MLAVLVQIPVGDLRVLAASAACLKLIVAYLPQNIVSLINKKTVTGHKEPRNSLVREIDLYFIQLLL